MGLLRRRTTDEPDERTERGRTTTDEPDERTERAGTSPGLIRALFTLASVAAAGLLIWIAQEIAGPLGEASSSDYWLAMALLAGAGLVLGLAQLFGGWTKWGWPTLSPTVFLLGFLPTLVVGGWIALAQQPEGGRFERWSDDIGVSGLVESLATYLPAIPLIVGLVLAFSFDTTGPRTRIVTRDRDSRDRGVRDEDVHDYRTETRRPTDATTTGTTSGTGSSVAEELRTREDRTDTVGTGTGARVDRRDDDRRTTP